MGRVWGDSDDVDPGQDHRDLPGYSPPGKPLNADFMEKYTEYSSLYQFLVQSPWEVLSLAELETMPEKPRDAYVNQHTEFDDLAEMRWVANTEWVSGTHSRYSNN